MSTAADTDQPKTKMSAANNGDSGPIVGQVSSTAGGGPSVGQGAVAVAPVAHSSQLVGIALPQGMLAPRLVTPMIPAMSSVTLAAAPVSSGAMVVPGQVPTITTTHPPLPPPSQRSIVPKAQQNIDGEVVLDVECGPNKAKIYLSKLCQGSKGPCVLYNQVKMNIVLFSIFSYQSESHLLSCRML